MQLVYFQVAAHNTHMNTTCININVQLHESSSIARPSHHGNTLLCVLNTTVVWVLNTPEPYPILIHMFTHT